MISTAYTVTTTAVKVYDKTNASERIYVRATGSDMYLGGAGVTVANGLKVDANSVIEIFLDGAETLYAIVNTGSHTLNVLSPNQS
tara:strand:- start:4897 stop:5151 length:255 start_codon:yes stop_codon:yes gene_type:complete